MPGRTYQLESLDSIAGHWSNSPGALTTAGPLQLEIGFTTTIRAPPAQQFFRLRLLP
jgi:hypothetical protein